MKKILCLIDTLGVGGAERQMAGLAFLLKQKGYRVDLVCYYEHDYDAELERRYGMRSTILKVGNSPFSKLMAVRQYIKQNNGFDCVISYKAPANQIGCLLKLLGMKFRLIVSERSTTQYFGRKEKIRFQLYRSADYVVPNSHTQRDFIKTHCSWLKDKTITITNFTDTNQFAPKQRLPNDTIKILTAARITKAKNIPNYLKAIALLHKRGMANVHFDWYGDVQESEKEYSMMVSQEVKSLQIEDVITFHPATYQIQENYQACDIFCLPSTYEGFPNVICEAMSCAKPIVCSNVCDNPNIVSDGVNALLFSPSNVEDMADKLQSLIMMSEEKRLEWGRRSREMAINMFSHEAFVDKYIKLIEQNE